VEKFLGGEVGPAVHWILILSRENHSRSEKTQR